MYKPYTSYHAVLITDMISLTRSLCSSLVRDIIYLSLIETPHIVELGVEFYASDNIWPTQNHSIAVSLVFLVVILAVARWEAH